jgi:hypothetical protein
MRRAIYIIMLMTMWVICMGMIVIWMDSVWMAEPRFGWSVPGVLLLMGGVGAAVSTIALVEEISEVRQARAARSREAHSQMGQMTPEDHQQSVVRALTQPALPSPADKRRND